MIRLIVALAILTAACGTAGARAPAVSDRAQAEVTLSAPALL